MIKSLLLWITYLICYAQEDYDWIYGEENTMDDINSKSKATRYRDNEDLNKVSYGFSGSQSQFSPSDIYYDGYGLDSPSYQLTAIKDKSSEEILSSEEKREIVRLHNLYRANATPPAANMEYLKWDDKLAEMAQIWAESCKSVHGYYIGSPKYYDKFEQNLYKGGSRSIEVAIYKWFEQYKFYDFHNNECEKGKQCRNYTTMMFAYSNIIGCGVNSCPPDYSIVCHYYPPGNVKGERPYRTGKPCTSCETKDGGLCYSNMCGMYHFCITEDDCTRDNLNCSCNLRCRNCGQLNKKKCKCKCKDGWDYLDCSYPCMNQHPRCEKFPGFPNNRSCSSHQGMVEMLHCRKMCEKCREITEKTKRENSCCNKKICDTGYILNTNTCECILLCPGPYCDETGRPYKNLGNSYSGMAYLSNSILMYLLLRIIK